MSCKDIVPLENPIKVPRWPQNPSPARKLHKKQMEVERESFISSPSPPSGDNSMVVDPTAEMVINRSPRQMEVKVKRIKGKEEVTMRIIDDDDDDGGGVNMAWKDLWVSVPEKKKGGGGGWRPILEGATGYVEPGEVLAIMGPSGSGKSTLLDALAGRLGSNTRQTGDILINGRKHTLAFGTSAYVTQDDVLMTTLTVKEAIYYSAQLQLPDSMSRSEKKERAEATIKEMGLQDAMNTRIGGWAVKGLSGGQKRRVSICVEILTRPKLLFLDEPTSGLDSATSYHVMNHIIKLAQNDRKTVISSIHQPSSEVFELFHNLCLLSSGRTVYFGSTSSANEFFSANGFPCPSMRNPSDHFLKTINKDFDSDVEDGVGKETSTLKAINILVKSYMSSEVHQQVEQRVIEICSRKRAKLEGKGKKSGFITQCIVLTKRSSINMFRDLGYYWFRLVIYMVLGMCIGSLFYDVGHSYGSIQARGSMLMFITGFLTFMAIGGFPSFVEDMKVTRKTFMAIGSFPSFSVIIDLSCQIFTRERMNGHYGVGAFVIGNTLSSIPYLVMVSVIPGTVAYYLVGLQKGLDHFFYFCFLLFTCVMLVESLMMTVASLVPDFLMGIMAGAGIQGLMLLNSGFFRLPNDIPKPFWKYPIHYVGFHKYAMEGFFKNEYEGLSFPNESIHGPPIITGNEIVGTIWQMDTSYSKWVDVGILFGMIIVYRLMFLGIIKINEKEKPMIQACGAKRRPPRNSTHYQINEQYKSQVLVLLEEKLELQKAEMEAEFLRRLRSQKEAQKLEMEAEFARRLNEEKEALKLEKEAAKLEMEAEFSRRLSEQMSEMEAFQANLLQQIQASGVVLQIQ